MAHWLIWDIGETNLWKKPEPENLVSSPFKDLTDLSLEFEVSEVES